MRAAERNEQEGPHHTQCRFSAAEHKESQQARLVIDRPALKKVNAGPAEMPARGLRDGGRRRHCQPPFRASISAFISAISSRWDSMI
jgi:hypothetical protein